MRVSPVAVVRRLHAEQMATLGIDIGCTSVKIAVVGTPQDREMFQALAKDSKLFHDPTAEGRVLPRPDAPPVLATVYTRIKGSPTEAASKLLKQVMAALPDGTVTQIGVTGTGGKLVSTLLDLPYENEFRAIARAIGALHPDVTTVFEMGGETSKFIHLETDKTTGRVGISRLRHQRRLRCRHRLVHGSTGQPPAVRHRRCGRHRQGRRAKPPLSPDAARCSPSRT